MLVLFVFFIEKLIGLCSLIDRFLALSAHFTLCVSLSKLLSPNSLPIYKSVSLFDRKKLNSLFGWKTSLFFSLIFLVIWFSFLNLSQRCYKFKNSSVFPSTDSSIKNKAKSFKLTISHHYHSLQTTPKLYILLILPNQK